MNKTEVLLEKFETRLQGEGSGRKWLFLHGLMGYHNNWQKIINGLKETELCLSMDQRGHGRSFHPDSGYHPQDYARDVKLILDELSWDQVVLVGHSMGGRNALQFCGLYPERVKAFVMVDISPEGKKGSAEFFETLLGSVPVPFAKREEARSFFDHKFLELHAHRHQPKRLAEYLYSNMEQSKDGHFTWRFSLKGILETARIGETLNLWKEWESLKIPTLLVRGESSQELTPEDYERMLKTNKATQGVVIRGAGHWVHADQPEEFIYCLKQFIIGKEEN